MSSHPIAKACPKCRASEYTKRRPEAFIAFTQDRVCKACKTVYTPPTPIWAALIFVLIGLLLAGFGGWAIVGRLMFRDASGSIAVFIEGFLAFIGILAMFHGARAIFRPGKV